MSVSDKKQVEVSKESAEPMVMGTHSSIPASGRRNSSVKYNGLFSLAGIFPRNTGD